jgi:hypothetical protein
MAAITSAFTSLYGLSPASVRRSAPTTVGVVRPLPRPLEARADEELIGLVRRRRDAEAFATLVRRYEHELFDFLMRQLGREDLAEEAFKRTFLEVHRRPPACGGGRQFRTWLYWVALRTARG